MEHKIGEPIKHCASEILIGGWNDGDSTRSHNGGLDRL